MTQLLSPLVAQTGIAALDCTLDQAYLIEASAGTGKTWTLTGIILRLLIEKKYPPERIIATTFTRAAAAEMQERISERLHSFYGLMRWLQAMQAKHGEWFVDDAKLGIDEMVAHAQHAGYDAADPINQHLLAFVLDQPPAFLGEVIYRTGLLLTSLDKLFVGTLDSLAQKWLKEFATQIGHQTGMEILNDAGEKITALVHDGLRAEEVRLKNTQPEFYQLIKNQAPHFFADVASVAQMVNQAMNFFGSPIDTLPVCDGMAGIKRHLDTILQQDFGGFTPYFDENYRKKIKINGRLALTKSLHQIPQIVALAQQYGIDFLDYLDDEQRKFCGQIKKIADGGWQIFTDKADACDVDNFSKLPLTALADLLGFQDWIGRYVNRFFAITAAKITEQIRGQIGDLMERAGQTTFTLQMVRLNDALSKNPDLARHIRHHYPVALIDESQDISGLQAELIRLVYLDELLNYRKNLMRYQAVGGDKPKLPKGFLLLVGDPKQAIYRFRGGDVTNYNFIKHFAEDQNIGDEPLINRSLSLTMNRRSNAKLIAALNTWFENNQQKGVLNPANLGNDIYYQTILAHKQTQALSWQNQPADQQISQQTDQQSKQPFGSSPVTLLHFDYLAQAKQSRRQADTIAGHINEILQSGQTLDGRAILPQDIAVLSYAAAPLEMIGKSLQALGIGSVLPRDQNVFGSAAASDMLTLLQAVIHQNRNQYLLQLLISDLVGFDLDTAMQLLEIDQAYTDQSSQAQAVQAGASFKSHLLTYLKKINDKWQKLGLSAALSYALQNSPITNKNQDETQTQPSLWLMAARLGERYLLDLERVVELSSEQSTLNQLHFMDWYVQQMHTEANDTNKRLALASESGVNLMTIHKSKGLEFPIVYVLGLDNAPKKHGELSLYAYSDEQYQRHLSAWADRQDGDKFYANQDMAEQIDEKRRLGYVALTRASEQLYIVISDKFRASDLDTIPIFQWLQCTDNKQLSLPKRLENSANWLSVSDANFISTAYQSQSASTTARTYAAWQAVMACTDFVGEYKTSFTALITRLDKSAKAALADEPDMDQLGVLTEQPAVKPTAQVAQDPASFAIADIRSDFLRGSLAGNFLHQVLEHLPTDVIGQMSFADAYAHVSAIISERGRRLGLADKYLADKNPQNPADSPVRNEHSELVTWLYDIMQSPFRLSNQSLANLPPSSQVRELNFTMGIGDDFSIAKINEIFTTYSDRQLILIDDDYHNSHHSICYRYLRGEIDLVYESGGRFFVVDYKSNYLGDKPADYQDASMMAAMDRAGYWLQAAIYQVALHRLLKIRIADYVGNEMQYLGGVEYVFLRGVDANDKTAGRLVWQPPLALIHALDAIF
ncbi:UvrD-helicase domain-containing protein [Moraxella sp. ZJ142]|uniref:UvrD-helicase domain-containing protein n=1 Tax=Moraxella marmotae TaxID=3344520 RepID=UPI0035D4A3B4